jgi:hypothetical protein
MSDIPEWKLKWKELFMATLEKLPRDITLSFSGGFDSSIIFYGLHELGRKPEYCVTFRIDGYESRDWYYTKKACELYDVPLIVAEMKRKPKDELTKDCIKVMRTLGNSRMIDVQCATVFDEMLPLVPTKNFVLGFFDSALFKTGKAVAVNYSEMTRGLITPEQHKEFYDSKRRYYFENKRYNHFGLMDFCRTYGFDVYSPMHDKDLFDYSLQFNYKDFNYTEDDHIFLKYHLYQLWKEYFDLVGNHHNKGNFHVVSKLSEYHKEVLLKDTTHKALSGYYNKIYKSMNEQKWF